MALLSDLILKLRTDSADFQKGLTKANRKTKSFSRSASKDLNTVTRAFGALGVAVSGVAFASFVKSSIDAMDNLGKMSDRLGVTTEALAGLRHAAEIGGVSVTEMDNALKFMLKNTSDAATGIGEAKIAFEMLGISAQKVKDMDPGEAFAMILDAIKELPDAADQVNAAMKVFGRSGLQALTMSGDAIRQARIEAEKFGVAIDRDMARKAEEANDAMTRLGRVFDGIGYQVGSELAPAINALATELTEFMTDGDGATDVAEGIADAFSEISSAAFGAYATVQLMGKGAGGIAATFAALLDGPEAAQQQLDIVLDDLEQSIFRYNEILSKIGMDGLGGATSPSSPGALNQDAAGPEVPKPGPTGEDSAAEWALNQYGNSQEDQNFRLRAGIGLSDESIDAAVDAKEGLNERLLAQDIAYNDAVQSFMDQRIAWAKDESDQKEQIWSASASAFSDVTNAIYTLGGKHNKKMFQMNKIAGIAEATISTYQAANKTWEEWGYPWGIPMVAAVVASGMANVAAIQSQSFGGGGASAPAGGTGGGTATSPIITQDINEQPDVSASQSRSISITIMGNIIGQDKYVREELVPSIAKALQDGKTLEYA